MSTPATVAVPKTISPQGVTLQVREVEKVFPGGVRALDSISFSVASGQFLSILGPSGCGKSTLLRMIAGLEKPSRGTIEIATRSVAFVFQDAHLLPWRTVSRNVSLPLELLGRNRRAARAAALGTIDQVGLADAVDRYPAQLSGGMKMRVSLARALVTEPQLLLLDEPFAALDEITRQRLDEQLRELWLARRMTVLFVTHSINEAAYLSERALVMSRRPGRAILDHRLNLPIERPAALRAEPQFAREMGVLLKALERGEGLE